MTNDTNYEYCFVTEELLTLEKETIPNQQYNLNYSLEEN